MLIIDVPLMLALNIGTAAMLLLGVATVIIRSRHFSAHGKEAMAVCVLFIIGAALLRWLATNHPDLLPTDWQRVLNSVLAIWCATVQWITVMEAELEMRARRIYRGVER